MKHSAVFSALGALLALTLSACGGTKMWPFGETPEGGRVYAPENATAYQCANGKRFWVRIMDNGATAWLIYPDREVGLSRSGDGGRYTNGVAVLEIKGAEAFLVDGKQAFSDCKVPQPAVKN